MVVRLTKYWNTFLESSATFKNAMQAIRAQSARENTGRPRLSVRAKMRCALPSLARP